MSDYISKDALKNDIIANLPQGRIKAVCVELIDSQPTFDEKGIIRKVFDRVIKQLEERRLNHVRNIFKYQEVKDFDSCSRTSNMKVENEIAIEIVKEECGIND